MYKNLPFWRSCLFVPANVERYIAKAHLRQADAIVLDLEDSVPLTDKAETREKIHEAAGRVGQAGADVVVRINQPWRLAVRDLEAVVSAKIKAICVPKVRCAEHMQFISDVIDELEMERQMALGHTGLIALIESAAALKHLDGIANSTPRMQAMILGSEDFSASLGMEPDREGLLYPNQQLVFAARQAGILPLGIVGSIADFQDKAVLRETVRFSRRLGLRGGFCIHPDQVLLMNEEFAPTAIELETAKAIVETFENSLLQGRGSAQYDGKMVEAPVVARAKELIAIAGRMNS